MDLGREGVDRPREFGVRLKFLLLGDEIMIRFGLLERRLPVLTDHHEGREEDCLERHNQCQFRPRIALDEDHPQSEHHGVEVHEAHRACERSDRIGDSQLRVSRSAAGVRRNDRMVNDLCLISHNWPPSLDDVQRSRIMCDRAGRANDTRF